MSWLGDHTIGHRIEARRVRAVIDLAAGRAVHARAGESLAAQRAAYRDAAPRWAAPGDAIGLVDGYMRLGIRQLYLADLDAIAGRGPQTEMFRRVIERAASAGGDVWIDAGIQTPRPLTELASALPQRGWQLVVGTETLDHPSSLANLAGVLGRPVVLSLDLWRGSILAPATNPWTGRSPEQIVGQIRSNGCRAVVCLALDRVGRGTGGRGSATGEWIRPWVSHLRQRGVEVWSGGGLASAEDAAAELDRGMAGVLLGTALLGGRISASGTPFCRSRVGRSLTRAGRGGSVKMGPQRERTALRR